MWVVNGNRIVRVEEITLVGEQVCLRTAKNDEWTITFSSVVEAEKFFEETRKKLNALELEGLGGKND